MTNKTNKSARPKSLSHAISEIEQFSVAEMHSELPEGSMPSDVKASYLEVGCKYSLLSGIFQLVTVPLMMAAGVLLPVFGDRELTLFDRIFTVLLPIAMPASFAVVVFRTVTRSYHGGTTRKAINNLVGWLSGGAVLMTIFAILFFHYVAFGFLSSENVIGAIKWINGIFFVPRLNIDWNGFYWWIMDFNAGLIASSYFTALANLLYVFILYLGVAIGRHRTKERKEFLKEWE